MIKQHKHGGKKGIKLSSLFLKRYWYHNFFNDTKPYKQPVSTGVVDNKFATAVEKGKIQDVKLLT